MTANCRQQLKALNKLSRAILSKTDLEKMERLLVKEIQSIFGGIGCMLFSPDGRGFLIPRAYTRAHRENPERVRAKIDDGLAGKVWKTKRPSYSNDIVGDRVFRRRPHPMASRLNVTKLLSAPLLVDGEPIRVLSVARTPKHPDFTDLDVELLASFCNQAAIAINNASLYQDLNRRRLACEIHIQELSDKERQLLQSNRELVFLNKLSRIVNSSLDPNRVLKSVMMENCKALGFQSAGIFLYNPMRRRLEIASTYNVPKGVDDKLKKTHRDIQQGLAGKCFKSGEIISYDKLSARDRRRARDHFVDQKLKAMACIPVMAKEEKVGVLVLVSRQAVTLDPFLERMAIAIGNHVGMAIKNASVYETLKQEQKALRESEERYRRVFEDSPIGLYRTTPDGRILMANPALLNMLKYSSFEELSRRNLEKSGYEPGNPRSTFKNLIESKGEVVGLESAWIRTDGSTVYVRESARAIRDDRGKTLYYEGTVEDITLQKLLNEISKTVSSSLDLDEVLSNVLRETLKALGFKGAALYLHNPKTKKLEVSSTYSLKYPEVDKVKADLIKTLEEVPLPIGQSLAGQAFKQGKVISYDESSSRHRRRVHGIVRQFGLKALTHIPVVAAGETIGVIAVASNEEVKLDPFRERLAYAIGNQVGMAIKNAAAHQALKKEEEALEKSNRELLQKEQELKQSNQELKLVSDLTRIVNSFLELDDVLESLMRETTKAWGFEAAAAYLYDPEGKNLECISTYVAPGTATRGYKTSVLKKLKKTPLPLERSLAGQSFKSGKVVTYGKLSPVQAKKAHTLFHDLQLRTLTHIPVIAEGEKIGLLALVSTQEVNLDPRLHRVASAIGNQVGMAIKNAATYQKLKEAHQELLEKEKQLRRSNSESKLLNDISRIVNSTLDLDEVLKSVMRETVKALGFRHAVIFSHNPREDTLELTSTFRATKAAIEKFKRIKVHLDESLAGRSFKLGKVIFFESSNARPKKRVHKIFHELRLRVALYIPVRAKDEKVGLLALFSRVPVRFDLSSERIATAIGLQVGMAIENAKLYQDTRQQAENLTYWNKRLSTFLRISRAAVESADLNGFFGKITRLVAQVFEADRCYVARLDESRDFVVVKALYSGQPNPFPPAGQKIRLADFPLLSAVCLGGETRVITPDILDTTFEQNHVSQAGIKSGTAVPLSCERRVLGALITTHTRAEREYSEEDISFLATISNQTATAIKKFELAQEVEEKRKNLERLSSEMIRLEEKERQTVAGELHDSVGQALTALRINLDFTEGLIPSEQEELKSRIRQTSELAANTMREIRDIEQNLRPRVLDDLGLVSALRWFTKSFSQQVSIPMSFKSRGSIRKLTPDLQITIYRITQEGLSNIAKHSQATQASVELKVEGGVCVLQLKDNGIGFDSTKAQRFTDNKRAFGIFNIRERVSLLGGKLEILSDKGEGTTLRVTIPVREGGSR